MIAIVLSSVLFAGFLAWEICLLRLIRKRRRKTARAPFRSRLAAHLREIIGLPFQIPGDGQPLRPEEKLVLAGYVVAEAEGHPYADEPQRRRRP